MKKKKPRFFKLDNYTWSFSCFVFAGWKKEKAMKKMCSLLDITPTAEMLEEFKVENPRGGRFLFGSSVDSAIWFDCCAPGAGIVSHECLHAVHHILRRKGVGPMDDNTEEAYAYLLMWFVREIGNRLW